MGRSVFAQDATGGISRKVISRVVPMYPPLAKQMHLSGSVKLAVAVDRSGKPKSVEVSGGHPLLAQAAVNAVYKWKWVPDTEESKEFLELRFNPD